MTESGTIEVIVVTGMSGAGKSTALNALEDIGYYCVDNLPPDVIYETLRSLNKAGCLRVALGVDVRLRSFLEDAPGVIQELKGREGFKVKILYLDAKDELLARRFSTTRRPHPLSAIPSSDVRDVLDGVRVELRLLAPLRKMASVVIESTALSVHELRRAVSRTFSVDEKESGGMFVRVLSFGFKFGPPVDADVVLDVRFLPNPYFVEELRPLSGLDESVKAYIFNNPLAEEFLGHALPLLKFCIPRFKDEGKSYVTIGIGCTGGRHRSVALTEALAVLLSTALGSPVDAVHRDVREAGRAGARPPKRNLARSPQIP